MATLAPDLNTPSNIVDQLVLFDAVLRPFRIELELRLAFFTGLGDGDEVGAYTATPNDLVSDSLIGELEMLGRFRKGRIDYRILDDYLAHC